MKELIRHAEDMFEEAYKIDDADKRVEELVNIYEVLEKRFSFNRRIIAAIDASVRDHRKGVKEPEPLKSINYFHTW